MQRYLHSGLPSADMRFRLSGWLLPALLITFMLLIYMYRYNRMALENERRTYVEQSDFKSQLKEKCWLPQRTSRSIDALKRKFKEENKLLNETKIILLYTSLFFHPWWWGMDERHIQKYTSDNDCEVKMCFITYQKDAILVADVVVFHGVDLNKPGCLKELSKSKHPEQKWVFFMHESPMYSQDLKSYNGLFNWTMTYMKKSDIFVPYFSYRKTSKSNIPKAGTDFSNGKTGKVVWVVSHCGLLRDDYVKEIEKFINVDVFGDCSVKFKSNLGRCSEWGTICENELKRYKFYLSFENCFCKDYITEKFWEKGLKYGLIPVVMGAIDKDSSIIKGSYIDIADFKTIEKLAKYLHYLNRNSTAYNEYFKWRYQYEVVSKIDSMCEVCKAAHHIKQREKVYDNIDGFWSKEQNCDPYQQKIDQIRKQISLSKFEYNRKRKHN